MRTYWKRVPGGSWYYLGNVIVGETKFLPEPGIVVGAQCMLPGLPYACTQHRSDAEARRKVESLVAEWLKAAGVVA